MLRLTLLSHVPTSGHTKNSILRRFLHRWWWKAIGNILEEWSLRLLLFCWWFSVAFALCSAMICRFSDDFPADCEYWRSTYFVCKDEVLRMQRRSTLYSKYFAVHFVRRSTSSTKAEYFVFEDEALYFRSTFWKMRLQQNACWFFTKHN